MFDLSELKLLDWLILVFIAGSVVSSILKGFARETISLAAVVVGLLAASWFYEVPGEFLSRYVKTQDIASLLGFLIIFACCMLAGAALSLFASRFLKLANLQWFDRLLGAAFGLLRGLVVGAVIFLTLTAFPVEIQSVRDAKLAPYLLAGARVLVLITPSSLKDRFVEGRRKIESFWRNNA